MHLLQLMSSWAVVCDVWYMEPQTLRPGETPIEFAERYIGFIDFRIYLYVLIGDYTMIWCATFAG